MNEVTVERSQAVKRGQRLAYATVLVALAEAIGAIVTGILAGSVALLSFGFDSLIEMASGGAVLWRLHHDADQVKRRRAETVTLRIEGWFFLLLASYVVIESVRSLLTRDKPEVSIGGIVVTALSLVAMIVLSRAKRQVAGQLGSKAMSADASQTALCSYLSVITLAGLGLNVLFGWWWADPVAGLLMVLIIGKEGIDALRGKACDDCGCA